MPPKTERFEMRLDPTLMSRLDRWSAENGGVSRAEAARELILHGTPSAPRTTATGGRANVLKARRGWGLLTQGGPPLSFMPGRAPDIHD